MNIRIAICAAMLVLPAAAAGAEEEDPVIKVQAWSFSDLELTAAKGMFCSDLLMGPVEKYKLLDVTGIPGPPGAVYTLQNNGGEIAIVKCGVAGAHDSGGGGGCEG